MKNRHAGTAPQCRDCPMSMLCMTGEVAGVMSQCTRCKTTFCLIIDIRGSVIYFANEDCPWSIRTVTTDDLTACPSCSPGIFSSYKLYVNFCKRQEGSE